MKNNLDVTQMKKLAHIIKILLKVGYVCIWISLVAWVILCGISVASVGDSNVIVQLIRENLSIYMDGSKISAVSNLKSLYRVNLLLGLPGIIQVIIIIKMLGGIIEQVELGRPFDISNARRLFNIGVAIIVTFMIRVAIKLVAYLIWIPSVIHHTEVTINVGDFSPIIVGLMFVLVAWVFKYGCYLQGEYDETV